MCATTRFSIFSVKNISEKYADIGGRQTMTEKIEWYKEVLELEPNSKVFFPLARMLADEGSVEEAVEIIEKGLIRHPEYLEARLYCIELLHKCGRVEDCQAHVERLSKMLSAYGEFWRAWASCIASMKESGAEDTASALRFLAANFLHGPISLSKIIEEGLAAVLGEDRPAAQPARASMPSAQFAPEEQIETTTAQSGNVELDSEGLLPAAALGAAALGAGMAVAGADDEAPATYDLDDMLAVDAPAEKAAPVDDDLLDLGGAAPRPAARRVGNERRARWPPEH